MADGRREVFGGRTHTRSTRTDGRIRRQNYASGCDNDVSPGAFRVRINGVRSKRQTKLFIRWSRLLAAGRPITRRGGRPPPFASSGRSTNSIDGAVFGVKTIRKRNGLGPAKRTDGNPNRPSIRESYSFPNGTGDRHTPGFAYVRFFVNEIA